MLVAMTEMTKIFDGNNQLNIYPNRYPICKTKEINHDSCGNKF